MKVSGATFVRNAIKFQYPVEESITSVLPLCDEFIVNVGDSDDGTLDLIGSISSPKIRLIESAWDDGRRAGGRILSEQTNIALNRCQGDWVFYIQADEVLHEDYIETIARRLRMFRDSRSVEGMLFDFEHFYSSYWLVKDDRKWYKNEIRIIRNGLGISSWRDAQGFRLKGRKLKVVRSHAAIYHYGWAKDPATMISKQRNLDKYWHDDAWIEERYRQPVIFESKGVVPFAGTHPAVMRKRIEKACWDVYRDPERRKTIRPGRIRRILSRFDRIGQYRNYILLDEGRLLGGST
jgi:glycosyltransferase involved in cell wall biosynthesis